MKMIMMTEEKYMKQCLYLSSMLLQNPLLGLPLRVILCSQPHLYMWVELGQ